MAPPTNLTASQIAAKAAMHVQNPQHMRKRSQTIPDPSASGNQSGSRNPPPPVPALQIPRNAPSIYTGSTTTQRGTAATAANLAFPRSPGYCAPHPPGSATEQHGSPTVPEKEYRPSKERSKMKLFSKPKSIGIIKDKDLDKRLPALPSPGKAPVNFSKLVNQSTTSLVDPSISSSSASLYSSANASTSTLVPTDRSTAFDIGREKEKHKHHFLSRQKHKLKEKDDHHGLALSSANSNSRPTDPSAPQPLYSFAVPPSPSHSSSFAKSVSGLDLRHGGKALREKRKEGKAAAASLMTLVNSSTTTLEPPFRGREDSLSSERPDLWQSTTTVSTYHGPSSISQTVSFGSDLSIPQSGMNALAAAFGLPGMTSDDAWPLLKARLLYIFEGEEPRTPIEDFNALVSVHMRRCIQGRAPSVLVEDLTEFLQTGFASLDQTLRAVPDERLVPSLVDMWLVVFQRILPFMQAAFLPLDLEFKGRGPLMTPQDAAEFWGAMLPESQGGPKSSEVLNSNIPTLGEELDVRRVTLLTFRDTVILPRHNALMAIFSRLSLENINAYIAETPPDLPPLQPPPALGPVARPGTASSLDPKFSSFNSQGSSHLESASSSGGFGARSRATSNTSAGSFASSMQSPAPNTPQQSQPTPPPPMDSTQVTEMVGRMLQCVSVLASVQSGDDSQEKMERLTKELKHNWLGRGRTGRNRRGFVGTRRARPGVEGQPKAVAVGS
ncbi:HbrB-like protein [Eremomyces bilateralis CBS 781.70]|uniref:HbrB-like protein n=1 Tax=Eremomyces bilateralis CBS 781.70 TaxID=1392243 RepID=A0A6G1G3D6_9PEZI|nr:HbrB-like protein [Eremomyces bilateralis CBS 781.70]KAF1812502.1 HbrB-like protein [Eremomyces bilateralis CBS 781.70]